jgi:hypothetical protein
MRNRLAFISSVELRYDATRYRRVGRATRGWTPHVAAAKDVFPTRNDVSPWASMPSISTTLEDRSEISPTTFQNLVAKKLEESVVRRLAAIRALSQTWRVHLTTPQELHT